MSRIPTDEEINYLKSEGLDIEQPVNVIWAKYIMCNNTSLKVMEILYPYCIIDSYYFYMTIKYLARDNKPTQDMYEFIKKHIGEFSGDEIYIFRYLSQIYDLDWRKLIYSIFRPLVNKSELGRIILNYCEIRHIKSWLSWWPDIFDGVDLERFSQDYRDEIRRSLCTSSET